MGQAAEGRATVDVAAGFDVLNSIISGHFSFQILSAAVEFDLFTLLARQPGLNCNEIASRLDIREQPARILLLGCVSLGFLRKQGESYFNNRFATAFLSEDGPVDQRNIVRFNNHITYRAMSSFYESLKENRNVGLREFKGTEPTLYSRLAANPMLEGIFHNMMGWVTGYLSALFVNQTDFSRFHHVMDVGGGNGENAIALAKRWEALNITIFDLPSVCSSARSRVESAHLGHRIHMVEGDCFMGDFPGDADCFLFAHFLEIWSRERIRYLLDKAYRSLPHGGGLFLINLIQDDDGKGPVEAAYTSAYLHTLASGEGMVYTWGEYEQWTCEAGFRPIERKSLTKIHGLLRAVKD